MRARAAGLVIILAILAAAGPRGATAQVARNQLAAVGLSAPRGTRLPVDVELSSLAHGRERLSDAIGGKPSLLILVDYTCETLCGVTIGAVADGLAGTSLKPSRDYRVLVVGFDPSDGPAAVAEFRTARLPHSPLVATFEFLRGEAPAIRSLTRSVGLRTAYDKARDQYAHPAAVVVLTPDGRISRTLDTLGLDPFNLRLALAEAGRGELATLADRVALVCYGWDAALGIYTLRIRRVLLAGGSATVLLLGLGILWLSWRERRRSAGHG